MAQPKFEDEFARVTGHAPFRWQRRLYEDLCRAKIPAAVDLPTGLGKTSVMAIWYLARRAGAALPRRLVYVVDRRAVVDQATTVAEDIKAKSGDKDLRISTLRGQYVDNREWLNDPTATAIVVGTVDMIGSRLLFEGYGVSRKMRPYKAGLLGADTLMVLDEAHLVPPFAHLLRAIEASETLWPRGASDRDLVPRVRLMPLSATQRGVLEQKRQPFSLDMADKDDAEISKRLKSRKTLSIRDLTDSTGGAEAEIADEAWRLANEGGPKRVVVFCEKRGKSNDENKERLPSAEGVRELLQKLAGVDKKSKQPNADIELLVGARRVRERELVKDWLQEFGFTGKKEELKRPAILIATAAGEVGVDMDADHMVSDLVPWERMVQRLGRVNRRGEGAAEVTVFDTSAINKDDARKARLEGTRRLLQDANGDASPGALRVLHDQAGHQRIATASTPEPLRPALNRAHVDAWSMTSLEKHTGRADIAPWIRGWIEEQPQSTVVWRTHLPVQNDGTPLSNRDIETFFESAAPHVSECLETETYRVVEWLLERAEDRREQSDETAVVFVLGPANDLRRWMPLSELRSENKEGGKEVAARLHRLLPDGTLVVSAEIAGLKEGMLATDYDVPASTADSGNEWLPPLEGGAPVVSFRVCRGMDRRSKEPNWHEADRFAVDDSEDDDGEREWLIVEKWRDADAAENARSIGRREQTLSEHQSWAEAEAVALAKRLDLPTPYRDLLATAARLHDEGKRHSRWQRAFNAPRDKVLAKTKGPLKARLLGGYRHEFGSLPYAEKDEGLNAMAAPLRDLALHLIAAHHGFARPVIDAAGCEDAPPSVLRERAAAVALRFARLQKQWGPWGLAWWEALLRAADQRASRRLEEGGDS